MRTSILNWNLLLAVLLLSVPAAYATHYRFGHVTWQRAPGATNPCTVEITVIEGWRANAVDPLTYSLGDGTSQSSLGGTVVATLNDLAGEAYSIKVFKFTHTYPHHGPFLITTDGCCRISTLRNAPDQSFRVETIVDLHAGNRGSPVSTIPIILQMARGKTNQIPLALSDPDGDPFTCRLATPAESRIPTLPSVGGKTLSVTTNGVLVWDPTAASNGWKYAAQVVTEEKHPGGVIGKAPIDFIIEVVDTVTNLPPVCTGDIGSFVATVGKPFTATIVGTDPEGQPLKFNHQGIPAGAVLSVTNGATGASPMSVTFTWTPTQAAADSSYAIAFQFMDPKGLQGYCPLAIRVTTNEVPFLTCPGPVTVTCASSAGVSVPLDIQIQDTNGDALTLYWSINGQPLSSPVSLLGGEYSTNRVFTFRHTYLPGTHNVNVTVEDSKGARVSCSTVVAVNLPAENNQPPMALAQNLTFPTDPAAAYANVTPQQVDNGSSDPNGDSLTLKLIPSGPYPVGANPVVLVAIDSQGLSALATATITIVDAAAPALTDLLPVSALTDRGKNFATSVNLGWPRVTDNFGVGSVGHNAPAQFPLGQTPVVWNATDRVGNSVTATQLVQVVDAEPPLLVPPPTRVVRTTASFVDASEVSLGAPFLRDNSGGVSVTNDAPAQYVPGTNLVTWIVRDSAGHTNQCTQKVIIVSSGTP